MPFLLFARPTPLLFGIGAPLAALGLVVRAWAAGSIDKDRDLAMSGPYAHTRNPMYLGSFVIGVGLSVVGGAWIWPAAFVALFAVIYLPTVAREHRRLVDMFGERFTAYAAHVPAFLPRLTPYRIQPEHDGFRWSRYRRYREWEAVLGVLAVLAVLAAELRYVR